MHVRLFREFYTNKTHYSKTTKGALSKRAPGANYLDFFAGRIERVPKELIRLNII